MYGLKRNQNKLFLTIKDIIMLRLNRFPIALLAAVSIFVTSCDDDEPADNFDTSGNFTQNDQMARPAINTVFVNSARKNEFNTTIPSAMNAAFNAQFQSVLTSFGYTMNALGQDKPTFAGLLVTDVRSEEHTSE